jgi:hypothetical protein
MIFAVGSLLLSAEFMLMLIQVALTNLVQAWVIIIPAKHHPLTFSEIRFYAHRVWISWFFQENFPSVHSLLIWSIVVGKNQRFRTLVVSFIVRESLFLAIT